MDDLGGRDIALYLHISVYGEVGHSVENREKGYVKVQKI